MHWGLGIGDWDWGLGIGPNPQSPIPNPQSPIPIFYILFFYNIFKYLNCKNIIKYYKNKSMDIEEPKNTKIFNDIASKNLPKKRYFLIKKQKLRSSTEVDGKDSKKIFKTLKDYNLARRKALRELKRIKNNNSKFLTNMKYNNVSEKENNSFIVRKVYPKKLKVIKRQKIQPKHINYLSKLNNINDTLINGNNKDSIINRYNIKLMFVYFSSIKNLCKYINNNFFKTSLKEQQEIDDLVNQIYQSLQILDRKINEFKPYLYLKDSIIIKKEDFYDISSLKENLLLMKKVLNDSMSQNLINIYIDIDNFCRLYL